MYQISNFTDNDDVRILSELGAFQVLEYQRDPRLSGHRFLQRADERAQAPAGL